MLEFALFAPLFHFSIWETTKSSYYQIHYFSIWTGNDWFTTGRGIQKSFWRIQTVGKKIQNQYKFHVLLCHLAYVGVNFATETKLSRPFHFKKISFNFCSGICTFFFLFKEENEIWIKNWIWILAFGFFFLNIGDKISLNLIFLIIGILKSHYWNSSPDPRLISCSNLLWKISESRKNNSRKHVHLIHVTWKVTCIRRFLNRYDFFLLLFWKPIWFF